MPRRSQKPRPLDDPRKPVDPRKPFTMAEAKATARGGPGARRTMIRSNEELQNPVWFQLRLDAVSYELIRIHATMRRVKPTPLISDILNCWLANATDYNQALVREMLPRGARAAVVPERYSGYLASLGYAPALEEQIPPDPPEIPEGFIPRHADLTPIHNPTPPDAPLELPPDPEPLIAAAPSETAPDEPEPEPEPEAQPEPGLSVEEAARRMQMQVDPNPEVGYDPLGYGYGAKQFDPEEYARVARAPGHGSGAQEHSMGRNPASTPGSGAIGKVPQ